MLGKTSESTNKMISDTINIIGAGESQSTVSAEEETSAMITKSENPVKPQSPAVEPVSEKIMNDKTAHVKVQPVKLAEFDDDEKVNGSTPNFGLIMGVPLEVTVEIGRTKKPVKEILDIRQGAIIELDKQAGDPVDIIVNGKLIAKGDVVVIGDNFGVRITEIVSDKELSDNI